MKVRLRGIDLRNLNHNDQYKVIKQITNDTCIRFVSNLFTVMNKNRITFCNNEVYVEINTTDVKDFKKKALAFGLQTLKQI